MSSGQTHPEGPRRGANIQEGRGHCGTGRRTLGAEPSLSPSSDPGAQIQPAQLEKPVAPRQPRPGLTLPVGHRRHRVPSLSPEQVGFWGIPARSPPSCGLSPSAGSLDLSARPRGLAQVLPGSARPAPGTQSLSRAEGRPGPASPRALTHFPPGSCSGLSPARLPHGPAPGRRPGARGLRVAAARGRARPARALAGGTGFPGGRAAARAGRGGLGAKPSDWSDRGGAGWAAGLRSARAEPSTAGPSASSLGPDTGN